MKITPFDVEAVKISDLNGLDPIEVFWNDLGEGRGSVIITCYGSAWTAYWGAMGNRTVTQFFMDADTGYLLSKLGIKPQLKQGKRDHVYLARIIEAIKTANLCVAVVESD